MTKYIMIGSIAIIGFMGILLWFANNKIDTLNETVGTMRTAIEVNEATINEMVAMTMKNQVEMTRHQQELSRIRQENTAIRETLSRHDIGSLAAQRPGLIEPRVNQGTNTVLDRLRVVTDPTRIMEKADEE